jgi:hypothetical protein
MEDAMSNTVAKRIRPEGRDVFEALYNFNQSTRDQRKRKYKLSPFGF